MPNPDFTTEDMEAAWQDGYTAAKEEEGLMNAAIPLRKRNAFMASYTNPSLEGVILTLNEAIYGSLIKDEPIPQDVLPDIWRDEFLTNVIVPFLEWIIEKYREMEADFLSDISRRGVRATPAEVASFQILLGRANALKTTIDTLKDWRG